VAHYNKRHRESTFSGTGSHLTGEWWKLKDPVNVANAFNNFFTTVTEKLNMKQTEKGDAISVLKD
jgi:hypothetical protein